MIIIKTPAEIEKMKKGGRVLAKVIKTVAAKVKPGVSVKELDDLAYKLIIKAGATPSFKNYEDYPASICASVNDEIVHAIPNEDKILKQGDIFSLDIGLKYLGMFTDMAETMPVGRVTKRARRMINVTKKALELALRETKPGNQIGDISSAIQTYVEANGFSVVRDLVGHGVGKKVHEEPKVPNFGEPNTGPKLSTGMTLAIEPMVTMGFYELVTDDDNWTVRTKDGSLSAHFEVTVAVLDKGYSVLTK